MRVRRDGGGNENNDIAYSTTVAAQFDLANKNDDIFIATTITENFTGIESKKITVDISKYITMMEKYSSESKHNDSYGNEATYQNGTLTMSMKTLFGSNNNNHYGKFGYALIGVDAAYNMYRALHGSSISITQATSSGKPDEQAVAVAGDIVELDVSKVTGQVAFRATCGSVAGTVSVQVTSRDNVLPASTEVLTVRGENYGCVNVDKAITYANVKITVTFTDTQGNAHTVIYKLVKT